MRAPRRGLAWDARDLQRLIVRLVINAVAIWVASHLINGIPPLTDLRTVLLVALIFGVVNALIRPLLDWLTCPLLLLTLGLFTFLVNALMLALTSWVAGRLALSFAVDGFIAAFLGAVVVTLVSWLLSSLF